MRKTMAKQERSKKYSIIAVVILITFISISALFITDADVFAENESPTLEAPSALLLDARRGQIVFQKSSAEPIKTPIVNQLMAAFIALEKAPSDAMVIASKEAAGIEGATLKLTVGEKYPVKSLIYAVVLTGSNDAITALSEYIGGSETSFVGLMNDYAKKIGMTNTFFTNATGKYDENQITTVDDMAKLIRYALTNTEFSKIFATQAKPWYDETRTILLTNTNNMFWSYEGTDGGVVNGFDKKVQSMITTATKNSMSLVCILADASATAIYSDCTTLFDYGFGSFQYGTLVPAGSVQKTITIEGESVNLVPSVDVHYIHPRGQSYIKNYTINVDANNIKPPVTLKTIVGMMTFTLVDETVINVELYPDKEIFPKKTKSQVFEERLKENKELLYVIGGLVVLEIIMFLTKLYQFLSRRVVLYRSKRFRRH